MGEDCIRIATRKSPLAMRQAEMVAERLRGAHADLGVEIVGMATRGDRVLDRPLAALGGKGLFVKELEQGLLDGAADIAVHSLKDVPADVEAPEGLHLPVIVARENPFDAFISREYERPEDLPRGGVIGTCSLRRASQLLHQLPGRCVRDLRGNVNTRLAKLDAGEYDAIVLARAGLDRLGMADRVTSDLDMDLCLPAIGQGALAIECRVDDARANEAIAALACPLTTECVAAERAVTKGLGGTCLSPIAGFATIGVADRIALRARVGAADGSTLLEESIEGPRGEGERLGMEVARRLLDRGAGPLLGH